MVTENGGGGVRLSEQGRGRGRKMLSRALREKRTKRHCEHKEPEELTTD